MEKFWIKKLNIYGENKNSTIDFINGLNIIYGPSNTGKTYIFNSIDYCLGGSTMPFTITTNHKSVELIIASSLGEVHINRKFGEEKISIESKNYNIPSGVYPTNAETISTILLRLLGIYSNPEIIKNKYNDRVRMGFRMISHFFMVNESNIQSDKPILLPTQTVLKTSTISALAFLISGDSFEEDKIIETDKEIRIQRKALTSFINSEIFKYKEELEDRKEKLFKIKESFEFNDINSLLNDLEKIELEITNVLAEEKSNSLNIAKTSEKINECNVIINEYEELHSQYMSDINRLTFVIDGKEKMNNNLNDNECPICHNKIDIEEINMDYIETSKIELQRIMSILEGINESFADIKLKKENYKQQLEKLISIQENNKNFLEKKLNPKAQILRDKIDKINELKDLEIQVKMINTFICKQEEKLIEIQKKKSSNNKETHKNDDVFPNDFEENMNKVLNYIFIMCKFSDFINVKFSKSDLDISVNNKTKRSFGKGYRSFINSCLLIGLREYLNRFGLYNSGLLIIDSPITTFDGGQNDDTPKGMKQGLIKFLVENQNSGQTIIIENKIPNIDYEKNNVKCIEFTKNKEKGRYGFLEDVRD